jgi:hypothetical protein
MHPGAVPTTVGTYPLALRLPLLGLGLLRFPRRPARCLRLWPFEGEPAYVEIVEGIEVELRITGTTVAGVDRAYVEAFVGRTHTVKKTVVDSTGKKVKTEVPRQLIFSGDARHVHLAQNPLAVQQFTARLMDRLVIFADTRRDVGVQVSRRRLQGRMLARVQVPVAVGDLQFAVRLPQPNGTTTRFVGDYAVP